MNRLRNLCIALALLALIPIAGQAAGGYILPGDPVTARHALDVGTGNLSPAPATLQKGVLTVTPAGNSTYGDLKLQSKTAGGTTYTNTIHAGITQAANLDWTWPIAYPAASGYALVSSTAGVFSFSALSTGTVGGSGTDNHIARWDGTGNIQDSGWVIDDTTNKMSLAGTNAGDMLLRVENDSTTGMGITGYCSAGTGATRGVSGEVDSTDNAAYGGWFDRIRLGTRADIAEASTPADPPSGYGRFYANTSGELHYIDDASNDQQLSPYGQRRSIMLRAFEMWPSTTNGCTGPTKNEEATNKQNLYSLGFQGVTGKVYAEFTTPMPDNWDGGSLYATFYWYSANVSNGVRWGLQCRSYGDAETIDQAWGTAAEVTDTETGTALQSFISAETNAITPSGTPAGGELLQCRVYRDADHAGDTELGSVDLIAVKLEYTIGQYAE